MIRIALVLIVASASAIERPVYASSPAVAWTPQAVRWPVPPTEIDPTPGWKPGGTDTTLPVTVSEHSAAVVWLGPVEIIRVRVVRGDLTDLRVRRVTGTRGARLWIDEPGVRVDAGVQLIEPAGPGSIWAITALRPLSIVVETTRDRSPRLAWEATRTELAAWIERDRALPPIAGDEDLALQIRLLGARAFVRALGGVSSSAARALRVWRRVDAELAIAIRRHGDDPYLRIERLVPPGETTIDERNVTYGAAAKSWRVAIEGPASLVVEACAERPAAGWSDELGTIELRMGGALAAERVDQTRPPVVPRGGAALPDDPETQRFGRRLRAELAVGPGRHTIDMTLANLRWVRIEQRSRRPRLRDPDLGAELERERARLAGDRDAAARAAERLLASAPVAALVGGPEGLSEPAAAYVALRTAPARLSIEQATEQLAVITRLIADPQIELALREALAFELVTRLPATIAADSIAAIVLTWPRVSPALLATLAPHLRLGLPSDAVNAAEQAWRQAPNGELTRGAMIAATRGAPLQRLDPKTGAIAGATATKWISPVTHRAFHEEAVGSLIELDISRGWSIDIPPDPDGGDRLAVIRVLTITRPEEPGPVRVWLDAHAYATIGMSAVEQIELAAKPGVHTLRVEAPPNARVFVTAPGARGDRRGMIRMFHLNAPGADAPRYALPSSRTGGPIRVELHTKFSGEFAPRTIEAWLHNDVGAPRRLVFDVGEVDRESWPLGGDAQLSAGAAAWVGVPPLTGRIWITTDAPGLLVHLGLRRGRDAEVTPTGSDPPLPDPLAEVVARSAVLAASPNNASAYLARARALVELGEIAAARRDLAAAAVTAVGSDLVVLATRIAELETRIERSYLAVQPPGSKVVDGVALTPLLPADLALAEAVELVRAARTGAMIAATDATRVESLPLRWARARLAEIAGRHRDAAALWANFGTWQADSAALVHLTSGPFADPDLDAATAYGLADRLANVEVPRLRSARAAAARSSRWSMITNTSANAGLERLALPASPLDPTPRSAVRRALLAAPWLDAKLLAPGREVSFDVRGPAEVRLDGWCRRLWSNPPTATCRPTIRIDQHEPTTVDVSYARATTLLATTLGPGPHQLTVSLGNEDPEVLAAIRIVEANPPVKVPRTTKVFLAGAARPAEIVIAGPATVGLEIRGFGRSAADASLARQVHVRMQGPHDATTTLALGAAPVSIAKAFVTEPIHHVVVVPPGPHRIAVQPERGIVAVRFARRIAAGVAEGGVGRARGAAIVLPSLLGTGLPWRPILGAPLREAAGRTSGLVPSVELLIGQDTADALDGEGQIRGVRFELAAQLRARIRRTSWLGELRGRQSGTLRPTGRIRLSGQLDRLPGGVGVHLALGGGLQPAATAAAWRLDAGLDVDRPVRLAPRLELVPELGLRGGALGPENPAADVDPWVAGAYRRDHPIQWVARAGVRARPFADQFAIARLEARSNADLIGLDQIGAVLSWRGLLELSPLRGPVVRVAYHPTYRFDDADRSVGYLRHDLSTEVNWGFPGRRGRFGVSIRADVYLPTAASWEHSLGIALRWDDATAGEAIQLGFEEPLADFLDQVTWRDDR